MNAYPTTPDTSIKVGDVVRSFDFPSSTDHYVQGTVISIEAYMYVIDVDYRNTGWGQSESLANFFHL
jgi:hypothetical protein